MKTVISTLVVLNLLSMTSVLAHDKRPIINQCENEKVMATIELSPAALRMSYTYKIERNFIGPLTFSKQDTYRGINRKEKEEGSDSVCDNPSSNKACDFIDHNDSLKYDPYSKALNAAVSYCARFRLEDAPPVYAKPIILSPDTFLDNTIGENGYAMHHVNYTIAQGLKFYCSICLDDIVDAKEFIKQRDKEVTP